MSDKPVPATIDQFVAPGKTWVSPPVVVGPSSPRTGTSSRVVSVRSLEDYPAVLGVHISVLNEEDMGVETVNFGAIAHAEWGFSGGRCRATFDVINGVTANFLAANLNIDVTLAVEPATKEPSTVAIVPVGFTTVSAVVAWGGIFPSGAKPQRTIQLSSTLIPPVLPPPAVGPAVVVPIPAFSRTLDILRRPFSSGYRLEFQAQIGPGAPPGVPLIISQHDVAGGSDLPRPLTIPKRATNVIVRSTDIANAPVEFNMVFGLDL